MKLLIIMVGKTPSKNEGIISEWVFYQKKQKFGLTTPYSCNIIIHTKIWRKICW